jgi:hypothetical protein
MGFQRVYFLHSKAIGGYIGLRIKQLNTTDLRQRLKQIYKNRLKISKLKIDRDTFLWFRIKNHSPHASNALRLYKFKYNKHSADLAFSPQVVLDWVKGVNIAAWRKDSLMNINLFSWWFKMEIGRIMLTKFNVY